MKSTATLLLAALLCMAATEPMAAQKLQQPHFLIGETGLTMQVGILTAYLMDEASIVLPPISQRAEHRFGRHYSLDLEETHFASQKTDFYRPWKAVQEYENTSYIVTQRLSQKRLKCPFQKGQTDLFMQVGVLPTYLMDKAKIVLPPIGLRAEHRFGRQYSFGVEVAHSVSQKTDFFTPTEEVREYQNTSYFVGLRNAVHCDCQRAENIDLYGGLTLGYNLTYMEVLNGEFGPPEWHRDIRPRRGSLTYSGFLGIRYACGPWLSLSGEIGFGVSLVQLGVGIKI